VEYRGGRLESSWDALAARLRFVWDLGRHAGAREVVLVQKVLPPIPLVERWRRAGARVVYDFDDALFERFQWGETEAKAAERRRRFDGMLRAATHVLAGSPPLADYVRGLNPSVEVFYPSLERERFARLPARATGPERVIGWVGNDQSHVYLESLEPVLADVLAAHPAARLRVCSSGLPPLRSLPPDRVDLVRWSEAAELEAIASFHVAVSPLGTDAWSRARGGRVSVLLSLAAGVPVVASPGGGLEELAAEAAQGEPGVLFARERGEWRAHLGRLLADDPERERRSVAAHALIERAIWADVQYPRLRRALLGSEPETFG
jgi:glycosyltransferase involved in cell wall biosynthesis